MLCSLSTKLGQQELGQIGDLEKQLGVTLLAFTCHPLDPAKLDEGQLEKIAQLEDALGISLVAIAA
jgi:hypothetical protein